MTNTYYRKPWQKITKNEFVKIIENRIRALSGGKLHHMSNVWAKGNYLTFGLLSCWIFVNQLHKLTIYMVT